MSVTVDVIRVDTAGVDTTRYVLYESYNIIMADGATRVDTL